MSLDLYELEDAPTRLPKLIENQTPKVSEVREAIGVPESGIAGRNANHLAVFEGRLLAGEAGIYGFRLASDGGSALWFDGEKRLDLDGVPAMSPRRVLLELGAGAHPIRVELVQAGGGPESAAEKPAVASAVADADRRGVTLALPARFDRHPPTQLAVCRVVDASHPSTHHLPASGPRITIGTTSRRSSPGSACCSRSTNRLTRAAR